MVGHDSTRAEQQHGCGHAHESDHHGHAHQEGHGHQDHGHCHGHGHTHGESKNDDKWQGEQYDAKPFIKEFAKISSEFISSFIQEIITDEQLKAIDACDVGAGTGLVTEHMYPLFNSIHAIDTSPSMLKRFGWRFSSNPCVTHSLLSLSVNSTRRLQSKEPLSSPTYEDAERKLVPPRSTYDLVYGSLMLHHVEDLDGFLAGLRGLVEAGKWVVFLEFGGHEDDTEAILAGEAGAPVESAIGFPWPKAQEGSVNQPGRLHQVWSRQEIIKLFNDNGFDNIAVDFRGRLHWSKEVSTPLMVVRAQRNAE